MPPLKGGADSYINIYELHFLVNHLTFYPQITLRNPWIKFLHVIPHHFLWAIMVLHNILCVYTLISVSPQEEEFMHNIPLIMTTIVCTYRIWLLEINKKKVVEMHRELAQYLQISKLIDRKLADQQYWKTERKYHSITKLFFAMMPGGLTIYLMLPAFYVGEKAIPYLFPVKNLPFPYYEIVYITNSFIVSIFIINALTYGAICWGLMLRISTNLKIISLSLLKLGQLYPQINYSKVVVDYSDYPVLSIDEDGFDFFEHGENTKFCSHVKRGKSYEVLGYYDKRLTNGFLRVLSLVTKHQLRIKKQVALVSKVYSFSLLLEILLGTCVFCVSAAGFFSENFDLVKDIRLGGFAIGGFLDIYFYCYCSGEYIQSEKELSFALYSLPWYTMDMKVRKSIMFMMTKLQRIQGMTIGRTRSVDMDLFLEVLKFSHSFITLLNES